MALTFESVWANSLIMNKTRYALQTIEKLLKRNKIATFDQLADALGSPSRCTIFRKLAQLEYFSSYSHRGKYYTLRSIARFDEMGLWSHRAVWFSHFGNLLNTAQALVDGSDAGYTAAELKEILHVKTKHALNQLVRDQRLQRQRMGSVYVYVCAKDHVAQSQLKARKDRQKQTLASLIVVNPDLAIEEAKATILLFCSMLDERQRRLYAGLESLKLGRGGDAHIASLLGMDPHTVARGRKELLETDFDTDTVRAKGGGRRSQEKKRLKS